mgnify:CR=1 FL=1
MLLKFLLCRQQKRKEAEERSRGFDKISDRKWVFFKIQQSNGEV